MQNTYANRDFYMSAFLIASGYRLSSHERKGGVTTFYFEVDERMENLIQQYYSMRSFIEPISYGNALKNLKSVIHSSDRPNANTENNGNVKQYKEQYSV